MNGVLDHWELVRLERLELADFLAGLPADRWDAETLCRDWRVRDVAGHVVCIATTTLRRMLPQLLRRRLNVNRMLSSLAIELGKASPAELMTALRDCAGSRVRPPGIEPVALMTDVIVHGQDIRRPLGLTREIPPERLRLALGQASRTGSPVGAKRRIRGVRLGATDLDWSHGDGPSVEGPAEALLMVICGRGSALDDVSGEGIDLLRARS